MKFTTSGLGLFFLFLLLLATNLLWYLETQRINSKVNYHATHLCELERLSVIKNRIPDGSSMTELNKLCQSDTFRCERESDIVLIYFDNAASCPVSGRPYCGFRAALDKGGNIVQLSSGSPCH